MVVVQVEIQSMQQSQPQPNKSNQLHSANQSQPNPSLGMAAQPTFGTPFNSPPAHRTIDSRSPLSEGIQTSPLPPSYKPITLPKFNGRSDPRQFIMSFEAAVASAGGRCLGQVIHYCSRRGCIGVVLNVETEFSIFMGGPPRQDHR
jgi:hypothetical protein